MPAFIEDHLQWWVAGAIVVLGLLVYGFGDVTKFSFRRAWAISKVAFAESIRRRVLWITPLAILGVIIVSQLQKPIDEQDAIRQTIKFSLFAAGMVVTVTAIILACTNLPREIDSRVIYTIVTKPTTRLEIVLGKVMGFAKMSLTILLIMGLFTMVYLHARAWSMRGDISDRLAAGTIDPLSRATYEYWAQNGLLSARTFQRPRDFHILAREPKSDETVRWFYGSGEGEVIVPFRITPEQLVPGGAGEVPPGAAGVAIRIRVGFARSEFGSGAAAAVQSSLPVGVAAPGDIPSTAPSTEPLERAHLGIQILDSGMNLLVGGQQINNERPIELTDPTGETPVIVLLSPEVSQNLLRSPLFFVNLSGLTPGAEYSISVRRDPIPLNNPVCLIVPGMTRDLDRVIGPMPDPNTDDYQPALPTIRARVGVYGQQLRGGKPSSAPVALYRFRNAEPSSREGNVGFEIRSGIERSDSDTADETAPTHAQIVVVNRIQNATSEPVQIFPENNRTAYFNIPAGALQGGDFDVYIRNISEGHYIGLARTSLAMVSSAESFDLNLLKSLGILWMLSILVVIISIFCSTFLSWPIAIVLTLVILLGHWGVVQLGDSLAPGIGNQVATDIFGAGSTASKAKVVSTTVEALSRLLNNLSKVMPDIGQFSAIEDIERGVTISIDRLKGPLQVLAAFGLPMLVLSYVFLRNKEVAP